MWETGGLKNKISARRDEERDQGDPAVPGRWGRC